MDQLEPTERWRPECLVAEQSVLTRVKFVVRHTHYSAVRQDMRGPVQNQQGRTSSLVESR